MMYHVLKPCSYLDIQLKVGQRFAVGDLSPEFTKRLIDAKSMELIDETKQPEPAKVIETKKPDPVPAPAPTEK